MRDPLDAVRQALEAKDVETARQLLRPILKETPSAEAWYLAARVANDEQRIKFLQNALKLDPTHQRAQTALGKLLASDPALQQTVTPASPATLPKRRRLLFLLANAIGLTLIVGMVLILRSVNNSSALDAPLTQEFADETLELTLRYPEGWVVERVDLGAGVRALLIANSQATLDRTIGIEVGDEAGFRTGEIVIMLIPRLSSEPLFDESGAISAQVTDDLVAGFMGFDAQLEEPQRVEFAGNAAVTQRVMGRLFDGYLSIIEYAGGGQLALFGFIAKSELDTVEAITNSISESVRYTGIGATEDPNMVEFRITATAIAERNRGLLEAVNMTSTAFAAQRNAPPDADASATPSVPTWTPTAMPP